LLLNQQETQEVGREGGREGSREGGVWCPYTRLLRFWTYIKIGRRGEEIAQEKHKERVRGISDCSSSFKY